jgi:tetracycline resistance efflux pump
MQSSWYVLLPPLVVLLLSWTIRQVQVSLLAGIVLAAAIAVNFAPVMAIKLMVLRFLEKTNILDLVYHTGSYDELYILGFLLMLGILIRLMTHSGGMRASTALIRRYIHGIRAAETTSLLLSCCFFMDDYLNSVTVGNIMRPVTDALHIPRVKLAFLLDSMSSALAVLIPITSWAAFILMQLQLNGISLSYADNPVVLATPLLMYLRSLPFIVYPLLIIATAIIIVRSQISFGNMKEQENIARTTGNVFGGKKPIVELHEQADTPGSLIDFIIPMGSLLGSLAVTMLYAKGVFQALFLAGLCAVSISLISGLLRKQLSAYKIAGIIYDGCSLMKTSIMILILAWTFSRLLTEDLHTGEYLATFLVALVPLWVLPCIVFVTSTLIASTTGSSWGTIAVTMPIALPMLTSSLQHAVIPESLPLLAPLIGAVLAGAVAGAHCSPITDAIVVAANSAGAYHIDHVQTQIMYSLPALLGTILAFLIAGFTASLGYTMQVIATIGTGSLVMLVGLFWLNYKK